MEKKKKTWQSFIVSVQNLYRQISQKNYVNHIVENITWQEEGFDQTAWLEIHANSCVNYWESALSYTSWRQKEDMQRNI